MNKYSAYLVCLILNTALGSAQEDGLSSRLEELLNSHKELSGTGGGAHLDIQRAYQEHSIPHIIHQTWKNHTIPERYKRWSASWSKVHPSWLHIIWSDEENLRLVQNHYPKFLDTYLALPVNICRADAIRPLILHRYGGVYADLDAQALRPLDPLLQGLEVVVARMGQDHNFEHSIPNAFMASRPGEDFLIFFIRHIQRMQKIMKTRRTRSSIESIAGPIALKTAVGNYIVNRHGSTVTILPPAFIFPVDWSAKKHGLVPAVCNWGGSPKEFDADKCISEYHPTAYSVQWWTHSWR